MFHRLQLVFCTIRTCLCVVWLGYCPHPVFQSLWVLGIYPNSPISSIEFLNCNNSRDNYAMCSVQQEHQRGAHSMIRDRTYRPVLVSYIIPRVIRNSLISRVRPSLMLLLNTTHRVVAIHIGVLEKRGDWNGRIRLYPNNGTFSLSKVHCACLLPRFVLWWLLYHSMWAPFILLLSWQEHWYFAGLWHR